MVGKDGNPLDQFLDEDPSLLVFGRVQYCVDVVNGRAARDLLETQLKVNSIAFTSRVANVGGTVSQKRILITGHLGMVWRVVTSAFETAGNQ
jgi:hypothetical protein